MGNFGERSFEVNTGSPDGSTSRSQRAPSVTRGAHDKAHPFARISNSALQDKRLSFLARGVLAYILSRPDNWRHSSEILAEQGQEGRDAIRGAFRELKVLGYCMEAKRRDAHGHVTTRLIFNEAPATAFPAPVESTTGDGISGPGRRRVDRTPVNRPSVDRTPVDRLPVKPSPIKRLSENDCSETTAENDGVRDAPHPAWPSSLPDDVANRIASKYALDPVTVREAYSAFRGRKLLYRDPPPDAETDVWLMFEAALETSQRRGRRRASEPAKPRPKLPFGDDPKQTEPKVQTPARTAKDDAAAFTEEAERSAAKRGLA